MSNLRRIVWVRHGETVGNSSVRFHGSGDVPLSDEGRDHLRRAGTGLRGEIFDLVIASPLRRSWEGAAILSGGAAVRLVDDFREIDFGRWEGLTAEEIQASDPVLYQDWQARAEGFEYPGGEPRAQFQARVKRGLDRMLTIGASSILVVVHKGIIRQGAETLLGGPLGDGRPELGGVVVLTRGADGAWFEGRRSSDPPAMRASLQAS